MKFYWCLKLNFLILDFKISKRFQEEWVRSDNNNLLVTWAMYSSCNMGKSGFPDIRKYLKQDGHRPNS